MVPLVRGHVRFTSVWLEMNGRGAEAYHAYRRTRYTLQRATTSNVAGMAYLQYLPQLIR